MNKKKLKIAIGGRGFDWRGSGLKYKRGKWKYSETQKDDLREVEKKRN